MIELKRGKGPFDLTPNTWRPVRSPYGGFTAVIVCSNGHEFMLTDYAIEENGIVAPAAVCPTYDCMFHEFLWLAGWELIR